MIVQQSQLDKEPKLLWRVYPYAGSAAKPSAPHQTHPISYFNFHSDYQC